MEVIHALGICWRLVRTWPGGRSLERRLKRRKCGPRLCPLCRKEVTQCEPRPATNPPPRRRYSTSWPRACLADPLAAIRVAGLELITELADIAADEPCEAAYNALMDALPEVERLRSFNPSRKVANKAWTALQAIDALRQEIEL